MLLFHVERRKYLLAFNWTLRFYVEFVKIIRASKAIEIKRNVHGGGKDLGF